MLERVHCKILHVREARNALSFCFVSDVLSISAEVYRNASREHAATCALMAFGDVIYIYTSKSSSIKHHSGASVSL